MTSLDRKNRAVNAHDIASQFNPDKKEKKPLKSLKSKNKELLAKYREKLRENTTKEENSDKKQETDADLSDSDRNLIPKVSSESFRGVVFDEEDGQAPVEQKSRKRNNKRKTTGQGKDKKKSRFKKFKSFKRSNKSKANKPKQE